MNGRAIVSGAVAGGVAVVGALGALTPTPGPDPRTLLDAVEAAAVTADERRDEREEWITAGRDATADDAPSLGSPSPRPQDLPSGTTPSVRVLPAASPRRRIPLPHRPDRGRGR
ncbi:hypothetical protein DZF92_10735 [Clavibacter michiganensis subsp. insidiosus]|nr:hypothetical protein BEH62_12320 [Clavibacter michiganensis subsp. insidiosus]OQJ59170.1 hypothetical protein B5P21_04075 [Clavibacter michiganensis subsp. insidiosus]RII86405.1 hypothetical protein DZF92_10735 [Clavibacter michiganensis subsp. insidiosus]RMC83595.1 hypothetical protein CmiCFBP2404_14535 [Clavibacter michiganensis subsp. insidiosus]